ncbi:MAG: 3'-5' exonuclease [Candidatus Eremiobacterota bacterium]
MKNIKIAIGIDFLTSFSNIPQNQQKRVREFIEKFRDNPASSSINYEKIHDVKDKNIRTVRISDSYRAIVLHPEEGNIYMLVWVDHHDEAMAWARKKRFDINPHTGALQIIDYDVIEKVSDESVSEEEALFKDIKDKSLLRCGVPEVLLKTVRNIKTVEELESLQAYLPQEVYDALYMFAAGCPEEEIFREMEISKEEKTSEQDFSSALENQDSMRRFYVVEDEKELAEILNAPLEKWRVFLHPGQRKLVKMTAKGPVRILGGAGTGKTVVAMHRAKHLAESVFTKKADKILFTTFSKNLTVDIKNNLKKICSYEAINKIEVINIDAWVNDFLRKQGFTYKIIFKSPDEQCWNKAMNLAPQDLNFDELFYIDEWKEIIQPNGINSLSEYLRVSRVGRGRSINREVRQKIWGVFEEYRNLLNENNMKELDDLVRDARKLLESKGNILPYRAIIVDEGQDMGKEVYKLIRRMVSEGENDIFITGDCHQKIYQKKVVLSHCGINVSGRRTSKLRLNYRTTEEIRKWAVKLLEGKQIDDMEGGTDEQKGYRSLTHGENPVIKEFKNYDKEFEFIYDYIQDILKKEKAETVCIVTRTNSLLDKYEKSLQEFGCHCYRISRNKTDSSDEKGIRLAPMHRVKGLEFDYVIIGSANKDIIPLKYPIAEVDNPTAREEAETCERALLYVAATRAKKEVLITGYGEKSEFLKA